MYQGGLSATVGMAVVLHVVGARPNFVKMGPLIRALESDYRTEQYIVHTGQHYDAKLSDDIISDLGFPEPDAYLAIGSGTHAEQTGRTMIAMEQLLMAIMPALVVVAGDVNATLAASLAAAKLRLPVAHLESGLRSFDWSMPEEINRVLTDRLSRLLLTHSPEAGTNLRAEGIPSERVHYVGNTMIDSLVEHRANAEERRCWQRFGLRKGRYVLATLHRPSNVDEPARLSRIIQALCRLTRTAPVVMPVHPRTHARLHEVLNEIGPVTDLVFTDPLGYIDFLSLELGAAAIITDSGGVQEEASALGIECFTLRPNTERPITIAKGTNQLIGDEPEAIDRIEIDFSLSRRDVSIPLWDGDAASRAAKVLIRFVEVGDAEVVFA
jgi:UDP-N-acetylglucosamine 2-epimerase (non-hydrolysing)